MVNQASNYLTVGFCNAFFNRFEDVSLITGSIHIQEEELDEAIKVTFINRWVERPAHKKIWAYLLGCWKIFWLLKTKFKKHEVFFVSIPPMAYLLNIILPNKFSMVIWDVFPDAFKITGMKESHPVYRIWKNLNKKSFKKSYKLFTIGENMSEALSQYVDKDKILIQPIWSIFQENNKVNKHENPFIQKNNLQGKFVIQYSGNIGLSHNVEHLVELAELMRNDEGIIFQIIGRGPRVPFLKKMVSEKQLPNCHFLPFQTDDMFPFSLSAADIGVVILDEKTSKGSVPSKSYNLMSYGIPSLYLASNDSELHIYSKKYQHAECFESEELGRARDFILSLIHDKEKWNLYSANAIKASRFFKRENADLFIQKYLAD